MSIDQGAINAANQTALSFTFAGAEVGTSYSYSIDDTDGGTAAVSGSGAVTAANQQVSGINVSTLVDGTLTLTVYLTDSAGNQGGNATDTVSKESIDPTIITRETADLNGDGWIDAVRLGFSESILDPTVTAASFSFSGAVTATGVSTGSTANDAEVYIRFTDGILRTDATPTVSYTAGTVTDLVGNPLLTTGAILSTDKAAPVVVGVSSSTADGVYGLGASIGVEVSFSEPVVVDEAGGTPGLLLETGAVDRVAPYSSGSLSSTLVFTYTVQAGDGSSDLDYASTLALQGNGGTIRDDILNEASLLLAAAGTAGSLSFAKAIQVDAVPPVILSGTAAAGAAAVSVMFSEGVYTDAGSGGLQIADFQLIFSANGGTLSGVSIVGVTDTAGSPAAGGESAVQVRLQLTGISSGAETVEIRPADGASIYDLAGNAVASTESTGALPMIPYVLSVPGRLTQDVDGDGRVDQIRLQISEPVNDDFSDLEVEVAGYLVTGYTTGHVAGDDVVLVGLGEGSSPDTGATPVVRVVRNGSLKDDGGNFLVGEEAVGSVSTDGAAAVVTLTLASGSRIYARFSEPVYGNATGARQPVGASSMQYVGLDAVVGIELLDVGADNGTDEVFYLLRRALTADEAVADRISAGSGGIFDVAGNRLAVTESHRVTDVGIGVIEPVWASDGVHTGQSGNGIGALRVFDGNGKLLDRDVTIQAAIRATSKASAEARLYFDVDVDPAVRYGRLWLPGTVMGLVELANTEARSLESFRQAGALRDYLVSGADREIASGAMVEFVLEVAGLYCARLEDPDDPRTVAPWSYKVVDLSLQRGGVTILSNVVNPDAGDRTVLNYTLSRNGAVTITVFNLAGDAVATLFRGLQAAGEYSVSWDGRNRSGRAVARGVYFVRIVGPDVDETRKVLVAK